MIDHMKSFDPIVFPESDQYVPERVAEVDCQLARPSASETRNFPTHGAPPVIMI